MNNRQAPRRLARRRRQRLSSPSREQRREGRRGTSKGGALLAAAFVRAALEEPDNGEEEFWRAFGGPCGLRQTVESLAAPTYVLPTRPKAPGTPSAFYPFLPAHTRHTMITCPRAPSISLEEQTKSPPTRGPLTSPREKQSRVPPRLLSATRSGAPAKPIPARGRPFERQPTLRLC